MKFNKNQGSLLSLFPSLGYGAYAELLLSPYGEI